jgi:hypothetical protein
MTDSLRWRAVLVREDGSWFEFFTYARTKRFALRTLRAGKARDHGVGELKPVLSLGNLKSLEIDATEWLPKLVNDFDYLPPKRVARG